MSRDIECDLLLIIVPADALAAENPLALSVDHNDGAVGEADD